MNEEVRQTIRQIEDSVKLLNGIGVNISHTAFLDLVVDEFVSPVVTADERYEKIEVDESGGEKWDYVKTGGMYIRLDIKDCRSYGTTEANIQGRILKDILERVSRVVIQLQPTEVDVACGAPTYVFENPEKKFWFNYSVIVNLNMKWTKV